jgi:molybdate transport system ATP-binding protein
VPRHRRRIGYVFQEPRLFPHLSVRQNLLFGARFAPFADRRTAIGDVVDLLGIKHLLARKPHALSGGEAQRVAIGRALLAEPRLLLMDEPLVSLDEPRRREILPFLERLRDEANIPILYVSHSAAEIARLATTLVTMSEGRVTAVGPATELLRRPDLVSGVEGEDASSTLGAHVERRDEAFGLSVLAAGGGTVSVPLLDAPVGSPVRVRILARDVIVALDRPTRVSALNVLEGRVERLSEAGPGAMLVETRCGRDLVAAHVTRRSAHDLGLAPGRAVFLLVKSVAVQGE